LIKFYQYSLGITHPQESLDSLFVSPFFTETSSLILFDGNSLFIYYFILGAFSSLQSFSLCLPAQMQQ